MSALTLQLRVLQEGASWQAALRALYALEAVVQQGSSASCGEVAVYFQASLTAHTCVVLLTMVSAMINILAGRQSCWK